MLGAIRCVVLASVSSVLAMGTVGVCHLVAMPVVPPMRDGGSIQLHRRPSPFRIRKGYVPGIYACSLAPAKHVNGGETALCIMRLALAIPQTTRPLPCEGVFRNLRDIGVWGILRIRGGRAWFLSVMFDLVALALCHLVFKLLTCEMTGFRLAFVPKQILRSL